jgi:prolyl-tRNA synthetase
LEDGEKPLAKVHTPGMKSVEEVTGFLGVPASRLVKTLIYHTEKGFIALLVPGDREVNETKAASLLGVDQLEMASFSDVEELTGAPVGFAGPIGLGGIKIVADRALALAKNVVVGANELDYHYANANPLRDFVWDMEGDIVKAKLGDLCLQCGSLLEFSRGIEVGHIFKLGTKYSGVMRACFLDRMGKEKPFVMGCYGIGITRTVAAAIEQHHDENGIVWPISIAPFEVVVLPLQMDSEDVVKMGESIYLNLLNLSF